jgi:holin-like protein
MIEVTPLKYLFQFTILCVITFIGELLNIVIPLPIPASIYGLVILFTALCTKVIKLEYIEDTANFFLSIMPLLFIPPTVSLMTKWDILKDSIIGLLITCILSTVFVMGITGRIAQRLMSGRRRRQKTNVNTDGGSGS